MLRNYKPLKAETQIHLPSKNITSTIPKRLQLSLQHAADAQHLQRAHEEAIFLKSIVIAITSLILAFVALYCIMRQRKVTENHHSINQRGGKSGATHNKRYEYEEDLTSKSDSDGNLLPRFNTVNENWISTETEEISSVATFY